MPDEAVMKWMELVEERELSPEHTTAQKYGKESRAWASGEDQYSEQEMAAWRSDIVRGNLWYRDIKVMTADVLGREPEIVVSSMFQDDVYVRACSAIAAMAKKVASETKLYEELEAAYLTAKHDNLGFVRLHWDKHRQLPTFMWVEGKVLMDKSGHGMPNRARWMAECVKRPLSDVLEDDKIKKSMRNKLRRHFTDGFKIDYERELEFVYIWSKDGETPWKKHDGRKYIVLCKEWLDEPICVEDWPWPFLDHDEFPIKMLRLEWIPGRFEGLVPFQIAKPLLTQHNWLNSYLMAGIRRELTKKVLVNEQTITEPDKLTDGQHLATIKVNGEGRVKDAVHVIDFTGSGASNAMQALQLVKAQHDEQTGVTDIARGQSPGNRVTATEARALERNTAAIAQQESKIVDRFYNDVFRTLCMAILYYVPQYSRVVADMGGKAVIKTKSWDDAAPAGVDEAGQPIYGAWVDVQVGLEEASQLPDPALFEPDHILRPGVDAWVGDDHAASWLNYDLDQLRRDFSFTIESGSSRSEYKQMQQRNALTMLQTVGQIAQMYGAHAAYYEMVRYFILSMDLPDPQRFIPDRALFMAGPQFQPQKLPGENGDKAAPHEQPGSNSLGYGYSPNGTPEPAGPSEVER